MLSRGRSVHLFTPTDGSDPARLRLVHAEHLLFPGGRPFDDMDRAYFRDLWASLGVRYDDELFSADRHTFTEMLSALADRLGSWAQGVDLAVLAFVTPDTEPGFPMPQLSAKLGGDTFVFAVSDQGVTAPFTALRLASADVLARRPRRALVLAVDQASILHRGEVPTARAVQQHSAVALVLDAGPGPGSLTVTQRTTVGAGEVGGIMRTISREETTIIGTGLARHWSPASRPGVAEVRTAPEGLLCTGSLALLARHLPELRAAGRRVLLADYDAPLNQLSWCILDLAATTAQP